MACRDPWVKSIPPFSKFGDQTIDELEPINYTVFSSKTEPKYHKPCWWKNYDDTWTASLQFMEGYGFCNRTFDTRAEAQAWAIAMCSQPPCGTCPDSGAPTCQADGGGFADEDDGCGTCAQPCPSGAGFVPEESEAVVPVPSGVPKHDCCGGGKDCTCDEDCDQKEPKRPAHPNNGHDKCIQCGWPTKEVPLFMGNLNVCANKDCPLYDL